MSGLRHIIDHDDPAESLRTEWLQTNGLGGYAMGTALGVNTRRYHGLLVAATKPPVGRIVALHSLIEELVIDGETIPLSTQQFGQDMKLHPDGWTRSAGLMVLPGGSCHWSFEFNGIRFSRGFFVCPGQNAAFLSYSVSGLAGPATLRVRPLTPLRDFHELCREGPDCPEIISAAGGDLTVGRGGTSLLARREGGEWVVQPHWWRQLAYAEDRARGQGWMEDVWSPGHVEFALEPEVEQDFEMDFFIPDESAPRRVSHMALVPTSPVDQRLRAAAGQFVAWRRIAEDWAATVLAGYPWFADWGRDTMIALPGLLLCTGRYEEAKSTLLSFARHLQRGLMPNVFNDDGEGAAYNTVDASLWFVHAVRMYLRNAHGDDDAQELLDACRAILFAYRNGTDFDIRLSEDGLITAGAEGSQLTWMDAMREGVVFTPRHGKAVEINALWHNALLSFAELTTDAREASELTESARRTARAMQEKFWWPERKCLHDVLIPDRDVWRPDGKLRCNQIFAVSLPFSPLTDEQRRSVVAVVRERLLTPFGLRTLDPADPGYRGRYEGDLMQRDAAYHNGTAWPWLIGPYCDAVLRVGDYSDEAKAEVRQVIDPLLGELDRGCLNQIAEVYDGDAPQRASGCPAQAWSVAELLRILTMVVKPTAEG